MVFLNKPHYWVDVSFEPGAAPTTDTYTCAFRSAGDHDALPARGDRRNVLLGFAGGYWGDAAVCMVVHPAEPVASSPGFVIDPRRSDHADKAGLSQLYGAGGRGRGDSHQGVHYQSSKPVISYLLP
jgi:hypothetical protein